jgi:siroheme synthase-like protein
MSYKYLPINLSIRNRRVLVVGGGTVALRKVDTLLDYDAEITVIAPEPNDKIDYYASKNKITLHKRAYQSPEAADFDLVISASDDPVVNREVYDDSHGAGVLVNIVDNPPLCTFTFPATIRRDCLSLAISTDGKAPFLAAHLRLILEEFFPQHWTKIARLAAEYRKLVQTRWGDDPDRRMAALERFLSADWKELIQEKDERELMDVLERLADPPSAADAN